MTATDSNGGVLTRENYDKLVSANKAYAGAVTTFGGVTSIDNDRLNQIMKKVPEKPFNFMQAFSGTFLFDDQLHRAMIRSEHLRVNARAFQSPL